MQKRHITFELQVYNTLEDLSKEDLLLMKSAIEAREKAYAPYSKFKVGAAVRLANGALVVGNNQENASYPSGLCAERVAVFQAGSLYPGVPILTVAISAASEKITTQRPVAPCGNCRQSMAEYEQRQQSPIRILMMGEEGKIFKCNSIADILPLGFDSTYL